MADITSPQAIRFANEKVRVFADALLTAVETARVLKEQYAAQADVKAEVEANLAGTVQDNATLDGRPIITGNDVLAIIYRADELITDYLANNSAKLVSVERVAVNGQAKF